MQQNFEYYHLVTAMDSITVEDVGNCQLSSYNDIGLSWYLQVQTSEGYTVIKEFGPLKDGADDSQLKKYGISYVKTTMEYNEKKICGFISKFVNNPRREITQVMEMEDFEFEEKLEDIKRIL